MTRREYGPAPDQHVDVAGAGPAVALLHGGFWRSRYDKTLMEPLAADLTGRGFEAWNVEYRRVGSGGGVPETLEDVEAALELAGPDVVAVGHSAGGHLALWAAGTGRVRAAVALAGVADLRAADAAGLSRGAAREFAGERLDEADPMQRLPLDVPVLLVHGDRDEAVPVEQSRAFARASGAELIELAGVGHFEVIDPQHESWHRVVAWIESL